MESVSPPAKYKGGNFPYVCKITDYTKMKEVYLLRKKSETTEAVHTYKMCVAAAGCYRIETIRCDKGGENTGSEFRDYSNNSAIKLEYPATNTPRQIGVSERDGQTLAGVARCLLKDGDFPPSIWGELMLTAAYLLNRCPHSALGGATPYSKLHKTHLISRDFGSLERAPSYTTRDTERSWTTELSKASYVVSASTARPTGY
ncbi:unnamed protein product [Ectocarpus sp. CCAP 1310/34]|nr:unnamed protein product [Ectocarpus sp. CCAP 1310/34]